MPGESEKDIIGSGDPKDWVENTEGNLELRDTVEQRKKSKLTSKETAKEELQITRLIEEAEIEKVRNEEKLLRLKQVEKEIQALSVEMQQLKDELFPDKQKRQKKSK